MQDGFETWSVKDVICLEKTDLTMIRCMSNLRPVDRNFSVEHGNRLQLKTMMVCPQNRKS